MKGEKIWYKMMSLEVVAIKICMYLGLVSRNLLAKTQKNVSKHYLVIIYWKIK